MRLVMLFIVDILIGLAKFFNFVAELFLRLGKSLNKKVKEL